MINALEPSPFAIGRVHGSRATYMRYGCRCVPCSAAARTHRQRTYQRARQQRSAGCLPQPRPAASDARERLRVFIAEYLAS
jgi:hypothetical protein